jgi:hypothetical protein
MTKIINLQEYRKHKKEQSQKMRRDIANSLFDYFCPNMIIFDENCPPDLLYVTHYNIAYTEPKNSDSWKRAQKIWRKIIDEEIPKTPLV